MFAFALAVYVLTLARDAGGGDSGELIAASATLGVPHPPGYPLQTLLGWLFAQLPLGTLAFRIGLLSALAGAGAAAALSLFVSRVARNAAAGAFAGALFAFSPLAWTYSTTVEVFALNGLFAALLLVCAERKSVALFFALFGLGLANHLTLLFVGAPLALYVLWPRPSWKALLVLVGALPYLYLPFASAGHSPVRWGDETTLGGFLTHVLRREYGTFQLASGETGAAFSALGDFAAQLFPQLLFVGPLIAAIGLWQLRKSRLGWALIAGGALYLFVFGALANFNLAVPAHRVMLARFWLLPDLLLAACAGIAVAKLPKAWIAAGAACALQLALHWQAQDRSHDTPFGDFAAAILAPLPRDALVLAGSDHVLHPLYAAQAEGLRTDVRVVSIDKLQAGWYRRQQTVTLPSGAFDKHFAQRLIEANPSLPPFVCGDQAGQDFTAHLLPAGICAMAYAGPWQQISEEAFARIDFPRLRRWPAESWEGIARYHAIESRHVYAAALLTEANHARRAAELFEATTQEDVFAQKAFVWKNLGIARDRLGDKDGTARAWRKYLELAPSNDPEAQAIRQRLQ